MAAISGKKYVDDKHMLGTNSSRPCAPQSLPSSVPYRRPDNWPSTTITTSSSNTCARILVVVHLSRRTAL